MNTNRKIQIRRPQAFLVGWLILLLVVGAVFASRASAAAQLSIAGYFDFIFGTRVLAEPTDGRPESKLWYNDGRWWAVMFNPSTEVYHIYWLNWTTQTWQDTGTGVDARDDSRADVLWDGSKLYVASHVKQDNPGETNNSDNWGRLYRFTYTPATKTYSLDATFPTPISQDKTRTQVIDRDSAGRLWTTYVSKNIGESHFQVFVNSTNTLGDDTSWFAPFVLPFSEATNIEQPDASSVITFGDRIGIMWSNQATDKFYFASRPVSGGADNAGWVLETLPDTGYAANEHINLKKDSQGRLFAAIKTHADLPAPGIPGAPLIGLYARDLDGTWSFHSVSPVESQDTRPIVVVHEGAAAAGDEKVYVFSTSNSTGGAICYHTASIVGMLSAITFPGASCGDPGLAGADQVLSDTEIYSTIDNATSTKQVLSNQTDIVILAGDQGDESYVHAVVINPPPYLTSRSPVGQNLFVAENMLVKITFDHDMNPATINTNTFKLSTSLGPVAGTVTYTPSNRTATFTPGSPLVIGTRYTVTVTEGIRDLIGQSLLDSPLDWTFRLVPHQIFLPTLYR
jgi:hypothetical protein